MKIEYTLRPAKESDREFIYRLRRECIRDVVIRQFGAWDEEWQRKRFDANWSPDRCQIIRIERRDVGTLTCYDREDHVFLAVIEIESRHRNCGLGTRIIKDVIARATAKDLPVRLQVLRENRAKALYHRLGFDEIGENETHYFMEKAAQ